jgi:hypothetical protein
MFYVCEDCGVTTTLQEFARGRDRITRQRWQSEINDDQDDGFKKRRQNEMMKWYLKQGE